MSVALTKRGLLRGIGKSTRGLLEKSLRRTRYQAVRRRLSSMPRPRKILVVCHGNICRSPFLAALLRRQLIDVNVSSAGFAATGESVPKEALELAARRRIDLSKFRSQLLTRERADEADLVIVMEPHQARRMAQQFGTTMDRLIVTGDLDADPNETRAIRDPWNQPIEVFEDTFVRLERCAAKLVTLLERG